ncbi:hypothetical protein [Vulcanisaeta thermophila]|uniref:hypothetical protein n=1 Tax=Vulcanisaeta thermophila TaxID=867917 RepID=UPI000852D3F9|nr:hypothetical protein [Vulcanisaeta thermophila]
MPSSDEVVNKIINFIKGLGLGEVSVEEYGRERVIIIGIAEDLSIYVSVVCNGECDVEYALGDENFTIRPEHVGRLRDAVDVIMKLNEYLRGQGIIRTE